MNVQMYLLLSLYQAIWMSNNNASEAFRRELRMKLRLADTVPCVFECHYKQNETSSV